MKKTIFYCFAFIASAIFLTSCYFPKNYSIGSEIAAEMPLKNGQTLKYANGTDIVSCEVTMKVGSDYIHWWKDSGDTYSIQYYTVETKDTANRYINHRCALAPRYVEVYKESNFLQIGTQKNWGTDGKLTCDTAYVCLDTMTVRNRRYNRVFTNKTGTTFYTPEAGVIKFINSGRTYELVPQ